MIIEENDNYSYIAVQEAMDHANEDGVRIHPNTSYGICSRESDISTINNVSYDSDTVRLTPRTEDELEANNH